MYQVTKLLIELKKTPTCVCGRPMIPIHCRGCGTSNVYGFGKASEVFLLTGDGQSIMAEGFRCRKCRVVFSEKTECEAQPFIPRKAKPPRGSLAEYTERLKTDPMARMDYANTVAEVLLGYRDNPKAETAPLIGACLKVALTSFELLPRSEIPWRMRDVLDAVNEWSETPPEKRLEDRSMAWLNDLMPIAEKADVVAKPLKSLCRAEVESVLTQGVLNDYDAEWFRLHPNVAKPSYSCITCGSKDHEDEQCTEKP